MYQPGRAKLRGTGSGSWNPWNGARVGEARHPGPAIHDFDEAEMPDLMPSESEAEWPIDDGPAGAHDLPDNELDFDLPHLVAADECEDYNALPQPLVPTWMGDSGFGEAKTNFTRGDRQSMRLAFWSDHSRSASRRRR